MSVPKVHEQALQGIRILDVTEYLSGPYCTMMLADLGAEVVKIERPESGDGSRQWGPPFVHGESAYYLSINRNKKSVTLNLKSDRGKQILHKLVPSFDVFIENYTPGTAERLGVDYATLSGINHRLVYCSISGFGQDGPYRERPMYDIVGQAMSGFMSLTGEKDQPPVKAGVAISDICAGMYAAIGILAALRARDKTKRGQMIDISLLDGMISWLSYQAGNFFATGVPPERLGSAHPSIAPYQAFKAADSYFVIAVGNDGQWKKFCEALGLNELMTDARFATNPDRVQNRNELVPILERVFATKPSKVWLEAIEAAGIPCGPVNTLNEVFADRQVHHRRMSQEVQHPKAKRINVLGPPIRLSDTPASIRGHPPMLGENTKEVLTTLGYTYEEIEKLKKDGVT